jgi:hypothetical protein
MLAEPVTDDDADADTAGEQHRPDLACNDLR